MPRFPRTRGGDPFLELAARLTSECSPRSGACEAASLRGDSPCRLADREGWKFFELSVHSVRAYV